jgi:hypothetical protein
MPWCEHCAKFWTPSSMKADGSCPTCGRVLPVAEAPGEQPLTAKDVNLREMAGEDAKAPWHFKVLVGLVVLYLGWRVAQLVGLAF